MRLHLFLNSTSSLTPTPSATAAEASTHPIHLRVRLTINTLTAHLQSLSLPSCSTTPSHSVSSRHQRTRHVSTYLTCSTCLPSMGEHRHLSIFHFHIIHPLLRYPHFSVQTLSKEWNFQAGVERHRHTFNFVHIQM